MSLKMQGLRTVIYKVDDIERAKEWYTQMLGFKPYFDEPFYVGFNVGGYELGLHPGETPAADKTANVLTYWGIEDVQGAYDRLLEMGATSEEQPTEVGGGIIVASVIDPWGNAVGLIHNPHFLL